jgi:hypothetical protein
MRILFSINPYVQSWVMKRVFLASLRERMGGLSAGLLLCSIERIVLHFNHHIIINHKIFASIYAIAFFKSFIRVLFRYHSEIHLIKFFTWDCNSDIPGT